jgi:hypothetical protein
LSAISAAPIQRSYDLLPSIDDHFREFEESLQARKRLTEAAIVRRCAEDPIARSLVPDDAPWNAPHRLMAAVQLLILRGVVSDYRSDSDPWEAFRTTLKTHREPVSHFVLHQDIQTNEVQRCFALLPIFLSMARITRRPLELVELGASGGLNLCFDRYRYRYAEAFWGDESSELELTGVESPGAGVPANLLRQHVEIRRRRGIDLNPVDVRSDEGVRLLECFLLGDRQRVERLHRAAAVARRSAVELIRGDYLEVLPELLTNRDDEALTVVFQTCSTIYLPLDAPHRLNTLISEAGREMPLAWISTPTPEEQGQTRPGSLGDVEAYPLELTIWPGGERRIVARMSNAGDSLQWIGVSISTFLDRRQNRGRSAGQHTR